MKTMTNLWLLIVLLAALGAVAGYKLGMGTPVQVKEGVRPDVQAATGSRGALPNRAQGVRPDRPSAAEMAAGMLVAIKNQDREAWVAFGSQIEGMTWEELVDLLGELGKMEKTRARLEGTWPVFRRLAQLNPPWAVEEAIKITNRQERDRYLATAFEAWARLNPGVALAEARKFGEKYPRGAHTYLSSVFREWSKVDFKSALAAAQSLDDSGELDTAMHGLASAAGGDELRRTELMELAAHFGDEERGREFVERGIRAWAQGAKRKEVEGWLDGQDIDAEYRATLLRAVAEGAGFRDPRRTAEWLMSRSTSESWAKDLKTVVSNWAQSQPEACGIWLESQMRGPEADDAIAEYSETIAGRRTEEALQWAQRIRSEEMRRDAFQLIVRRMEPIPAEEVRQNLEQAGLDEKLVADLLAERRREREGAPERLNKESPKGAPHSNSRR